MWKVVFTRQAAKDARSLKAGGLDAKAKRLVSLMSQDSFASPPSFEPLAGNLSGLYSRRISLQHRLVYEVVPSSGGDGCEGVVKVIRMWTHYERLG